MRRLLSVLFFLLPFNVSAQFLLGVCTHFGHGDRDIQSSLNILKKIGFSSIRDEVLWSHVERSRGKFSFEKEDEFIGRSVKEGVRPLIVLGYGNDIYGPRDKPLNTVMLDGYEEYVRRVASRYRGLVWGYEIWNEYDGRAGKYPVGDFQSYARLINRVSVIIKRIDPSAVILVGGITPVSVDNGWLAGLARVIDFRNVDGVSIHPYAQGRSLLSEEVDFSTALVEKTVNELKSVGFIGPGRRGKVYVTEIGWQTSSGISEGQAAERLSEFIARMRVNENVGGVWIYELENSGLNFKDGEHNYGLFSKGLGRQRYFFK